MAKKKASTNKQPAGENGSSQAVAEQDDQAPAVAETDEQGDQSVASQALNLMDQAVADAEQASQSLRRQYLELLAKDRGTGDEAEALQSTILKLGLTRDQVQRDAEIIARVRQDRQQLEQQRAQFEEHKRKHDELPQLRQRRKELWEEFNRLDTEIRTREGAGAHIQSQLTQAENQMAHLRASVPDHVAAALGESFPGENETDKTTTAPAGGGGPV
jgi:chromosome segregation ATPase